MIKQYDGRDESKEIKDKINKAMKNKTKKFIATQFRDEPLKVKFYGKKKQKAAHLTKDGYCCACEYDIACVNEKLESQKEAFEGLEEDYLAEIASLKKSKKGESWRRGFQQGKEETKKEIMEIMEEARVELSNTKFPDPKDGKYVAGFEAGKELAQNYFSQIINKLKE